MKHVSFLFAAFLSLPLASPVLAQHQHGAPAAPALAARTATLLPGMGSHTHPITTASPEAQKFFDQGLTLIYGFNHEEAILSFRRAAELDPGAPMPHWGIALALGSNYNDPQPEAERLKKAYEEVQKAIALSSGGPESERAYAQAVARRYAADPGAADKAQLLRDYNAAMRELSTRYPDDLDAATLYAESGMNLRPWKLWKADGTPADGTEEIVRVLESVLKRDPSHPGANHYYIHAVEASQNPERALPSAARLQTLVPGAGHLVHMPAHIYMRTGEYLAAEKANAEAADVDRAYFRQAGAQGFYPLAYYEHNLHFGSAAAAMAGRYAAAKKAADLLYQSVLPAVPMAPEMIEGYLLQPLFIELRFKKWDQIAGVPDPGPKLPLVRAVWRYARGVAAASRGDVKKAETEREAFAAARDALPAGIMLGMNNSGTALLAVATAVLDAEIAQARRNRRGAIESWKTAVAAQDALSYDEPPPWYYPVRESLGAALLRDGRAAEAEKVFREDLDRNPRSGRSLLGLAESLKAQGRSTDASWVQGQFESAWKDADARLRLEDL